MKPFSTIAIPHRDIQEGRLTMDVFAADLWQVFKGSAPDEYQSPEVFFRKTYLTVGMKNLLDVVKKRLDGRGGDPIIQLQTPFGGGKTHSLIALFHKAKEWEANVVVIDGTAFDPRETTLWGEIERQLTGNISLLKGGTTPGKEKLTELLKEHQPLLILMDEVLEYAIKSSGINVGSSNLASQTVAFIQELSGTISILPNSILVLTLPSSLIEHYDENGEQLFQRLQKVLGRVEKIFTPVQDEEISQVIRRRLFSYIDENSATEVINDFLDYADRERILPEGVDIADYRDRFKASYPFQPEVIDVLYKRWGSFPSFQRTRGVLRILALVVHSLKNSNIPFIRLGDFDLNNQELRRELIKHIGGEYDSVVDSDFVSNDAGAKKVDRELGDAYKPFAFGTKSATAIFMYSFSGGPRRGATLNEIKLACAVPSTPSSIVVEAVSKLQKYLFYISDTSDISDKELFFTNQPNLNRILLTKMESIEKEKLVEHEKELLGKSFSKEYFEVYIWPSNSKDVPDGKRLKLIVLKNQESCKDFLENCGERPRVYRNSLIFLTPAESERINFEKYLKQKIAWELIKKDVTLRITEEQRKRVFEEIKNSESSFKEHISGLYRRILCPSRDGFKEIDLGIPTYGENISLDKKVFEKLKTEGDLLEKLSPLTFKEKYFKDKEYVETKNILESFFTTPGEIRITKDEVLKVSIKEGVKQGLFGIGVIENGIPKCRNFKEECSPELVENEIIIRAELCTTVAAEGISEAQSYGYETSAYEDKRFEIVEEEKEELQTTGKPKYRHINLSLIVPPSGKFSDVFKMINYLKNIFAEVNVRIEISAKEGEIQKSDYEDKILEALHQAEVKIEKEELL
jgi:hypothetical protein